MAAAGAAAASPGTESQPLDPSDGTVPGPVVEPAKTEEVSPAGGATGFDSAGHK